MKRGATDPSSQVAERWWPATLDRENQPHVVGNLTLSVFCHTSATGAIPRPVTIRKREKTTAQLKCGLLDAKVVAVSRDDTAMESFMSTGERFRRATLIDGEPRCTPTEMPVQLGQHRGRRFEHGTGVSAVNGMEEAVYIATVDEQDLCGIGQA